MSILYFLNLILISSFTPATLFSLTNNIAELKYQWQTGFYTGMPVDHFYGLTQDTFNIKFLYNLDYYQTGGPIFFYMGNEGPVEIFAQNTVKFLKAGCESRPLSPRYLLAPIRPNNQALRIEEEGVSEKRTGTCL